MMKCEPWMEKDLPSRARYSHGWRLLERRPIVSGPHPDGGFVLYAAPIGYWETWYCTRCRYVEQRKVDP